MQENTKAVQFAIEKYKTVSYEMYTYFLFMDADCEENTELMVCKKRYKSLNGTWNHQRQKNPNEVIQILARNLYSEGKVL